MDINQHKARLALVLWSWSVAPSRSLLSAFKEQPIELARQVSAISAEDTLFVDQKLLGALHNNRFEPTKQSPVHSRLSHLHPPLSYTPQSTSLSSEAADGSASGVDDFGGPDPALGGGAAPDLGGGGGVLLEVGAKSSSRLFFSPSLK